MIVATIVLIALGVIMLVSTSAFAATSKTDIYYDVKRQFLWIGIGGFCCAFFAMVDYRTWQRSAVIWYVVAAILLLLCFVPMVGEKLNGAYRWISGKSFGLSMIRMQPSEFARIAAVVFMAAWFSRFDVEARDRLRGFVYPLGFLLGLAGLIAAEVDLGNAALVCITGAAIMYVAGTRVSYLAALVLAGASALTAVILLIPNRINRILAFMNLEEHQQGFGMQQWRGLLAFGSGGMEGLGLGSGRQKMLYLPYAHTDFIFPMVGEELGLRACLIVVLLFVVLLVAGSLIAMHAPDKFGKLLGVGLVGTIAFQALINMGVTTAVLPNKGLPLPFVSYGGSNLVCCLIAVGILLNIYRQGINMQGSNMMGVIRTKVTPRL